jgi:hypothetical protein
MVMKVTVMTKNVNLMQLQCLHERFNNREIPIILNAGEDCGMILMAD